MVIGYDGHMHFLPRPVDGAVGIEIVDIARLLGVVIAEGGVNRLFRAEPVGLRIGEDFLYLLNIVGCHIPRLPFLVAGQLHGLMIIALLVGAVIHVEPEVGTGQRLSGGGAHHNIACGVLGQSHGQHLHIAHIVESSLHGDILVVGLQFHQVHAYGQFRYLQRVFYGLVGRLSVIAPFLLYLVEGHHGRFYEREVFIRPQVIVSGGIEREAGHGHGDFLHVAQRHASHFLRFGGQIPLIAEVDMKVRLRDFLQVVAQDVDSGPAAPLAHSIVDEVDPILQSLVGTVHERVAVNGQFTGHFDIAIDGKQRVDESSAFRRRQVFAAVPMSGAHHFAGCEAGGRAERGVAVVVMKHSVVLGLIAYHAEQVVVEPASVIAVFNELLIFRHLMACQEFGLLKRSLEIGLSLAAAQLVIVSVEASEYGVPHSGEYGVLGPCLLFHPLQPGHLS